MNNVSLERVGDALVAAKRSESLQRLAEEADLLKRFHHPGVVEFISFAEGNTPVLITAWAGTDTWERRSPTDLDGALPVLAAVAATLADLHLAGITHGSLSPDHVIIANDGRPVICGFGSAGPADTAGLETDRAGLRALLDFVIDSIGGRGSSRLEVLGQWLDDPHSDPAGFARLVDADIVTEASPRPPLSTRSKRVMIGGLAVVAIGFALVATRHRDPITMAATPPEAPAITAVSTTTISVTTTVPRHPTISADTSGTINFDAPDSQSTPLIVQHGGRRYGLGNSDDLAVLGDWNCDGDDTPAILQVAAGVVAVFDAWPEPGDRIDPQFTVATPDVESLQAETAGDCDVLRARSPYGSRIITEETQ